MLNSSKAMFLSSFFSDLCSSLEAVKAYDLCNWSKLPDDLIIEILYRLEEKPLVRLKCVSKSWNVLISNFCVPKMYPSSTYLAGLLCKWTVRRGTSLFSKKFDMEYYPCQEHSSEFPPDPDNCGGIEKSYNGILQFERSTGNDVYDCCNGLLLLGKGVPHGYQYFVCNPATKQCVSIPTNYCHLVTMFAALAFDPHLSPHYTIVRVNSVRNLLDKMTVSNPPKFDLFSSFTGKWVSQSVPLDLEVCGSDWGAYRVFLNGILYMLSLAGYLLHFEFSLGNLRAGTFKLPDIDSGRADRGQFIGLSEGCLYYSTRDEINIKLWSYMNDCGKAEWVFKYNISIDYLVEQPFVYLRFHLKVYALDPSSDVVFIGLPMRLWRYHPKSKRLEVFSNMIEDKHFVKGFKYLVFPYSPCVFFLNNFPQQPLAHPIYDGLGKEGSEELQHRQLEAPKHCCELAVK